MRGPDPQFGKSIPFFNGRIKSVLTFLWRVLYNGFAMKKTILCVFLILLLVAAAAVGLFVMNELRQLKETEALADELLSEQNYGEAVPAYGQLLQETPISFLGWDRAYVERGQAGVLFCVDTLLGSLEGAGYLADNGSIPAVLACTTNPAVSDDFPSALEERAARGAAMLAAEAERIRQEEEARAAAQAAAEAEARRRQELLDAALAAREAGRLEEALALVKESGLRPELIGEIEDEIVRKHDEGLTADARAALEGLRLLDALTLAEQVTDPALRDGLTRELHTGWTKKTPQLREKFHNKLFAGAWYTLALGDDVLLAGDRRYEGLDGEFTGTDTVIGGMFGWMRLSGGQVELIGDTLGATAAAAEITDAVDGAMGWTHGLILHRDGAVTNLGAWTYGRRAVSEWTDIRQVAAGGFHSLGLTKDGTVVAAGLDLDGQCQVADWTGVVSVAAGLRHSVALTKSGRVLAAGDNSFGQCDVAEWTNIVDIRCGGNFTLGLTADGRLLAVGDNGCGQCDVDEWENVVAFDGGLWHTAALLQDGHVVSAGADGHGQCGLQGAVLIATGYDSTSAGPFAESETELVYEGDATYGPWLYYGGDGVVIASFDVDTGKIKATRADLICTYGHPPVGILSGGGDKPSSALKASTVARQNRAVFALTGDYFTFGYNADGIQMRRGTVFKEEKDEMGFGFYPDGSLRIIDPETITAQELLDQGVTDTWVFGPVLIEDGEAVDIHTHPLAHNDVTMRSVMASVCPYHHIGAAYGISTLAQVVDDLLSCGCTVAYNLDGGRSSWLVFMGKEINKSVYTYDGWRGLQDMVGFLTSELVPKPR